MSNSAVSREWIEKLPKAELHIHIDGSLEAERMLQLAEKNRIPLPYRHVEDVHAAYHFGDLQSFLDLYYLGASVLCDEEDFYHLMMDYLKQCRVNNILHTEIMIEPQTYLPKGIAFDVFMAGFRKAVADAQAGWGQSVSFILSLLKHTSEQECIDVLNLADPWRDDFIALGMASTEIGNPPEKFARLYQLGAEKGYQLTNHAGEEGPPEVVWGSLKTLHVTRIDHGVRAIEDPRLVEYLARNQIPLTVCPLSNVRLRVFDTMAQHNIMQLFANGLLVTVNSDDPAYFGGYLNDNYWAISQEFNLDRATLVSLAKNSFHASYLPDSARLQFLESFENLEV